MKRCPGCGSPMIAWSAGKNGLSMRAWRWDCAPCSITVYVPTSPTGAYSLSPARASLPATSPRPPASGAGRAGSAA